MALRIRFPYYPTYTLGYSVERENGDAWDFSNSSWSASPVTRIQSLTALGSPRIGRYDHTISSTPVATWPDGRYLVTIHDTSSAGNSGVVYCYWVEMAGGEDTSLPSGGGILF